MLSYDGHDFETLFVVGDPELGIANFSPNYMDTDARDGSYVRGVSYDGSSVSFTVVATGTASERALKLSTLSSWLNVDEPKRLVLPDTPDIYFMAVPSGGISLTRGIGAEYGQLTFDIVEPAGYGSERSVWVNTNRKRFYVGGNYPATVRIEATWISRESTSTPYWGLNLDDDTFLRVRVNSYNSVPASIDCDERTCVVNGSPTTITLESDWLELEPGEHEIFIDVGRGSVNLNFTERWAR